VERGEMKEEVDSGDNRGFTCGAVVKLYREAGILVESHQENGCGRKKHTVADCEKYKRDESGYTTYPTGDYTIFATFPFQSRFGENSLFAREVKFGKGCVFEQGCRFGDYSDFGEDCSFGHNSYFGIACSFRKGCTFMALDFNLLRAYLKDVSDELCLELMRRNALMFPSSELAYKIWSDPLSWAFNFSTGMTHFFNTKLELWKPGKPTMTDYELLMLIFHEKGWKYEPVMSL
jgi:hypothetical protein